MHGSRHPALQLTLRQAFEHYLLPDLASRAAPRTIEAYRTKLGRWEKLSGDPAVGAIDNACMLRFREAGVAAGLRPATVNSVWSHMRAVLRRLGPQSEYHNPLGEGILARVPHMRPLRVGAAVPRRVSLDDIDTLYRACDGARWPKCCVPAPEWWRTAVCLAYNCGLRRNDLFALPMEAFDLEKRQLRFVAHKPGRVQVLPVNDVVIAHVLAIWSERADLFPGTASLISGENHRYNVEWRRLQAAAGVRFTIHDLRRTCGSAFADLGGVELARFVLGHSARDVTSTFYVAPTERAIRAAHELPQPASFREPKRCVVAPAIRRTDWQFTRSQAVFRGETVLRLPPRPLAILRALIAAGRPLGSAELARIAFWHDPAVSPETVKGAVYRLRAELARAFRLRPEKDPVPWDHIGGSGWALVLPAEYFAPNVPGSGGRPQ